MSYDPRDFDFSDRADLEANHSYPGYVDGAVFANLDAYRLDPDEHVQITLSGGSSSAYAAWHVLEANGGLSPNWRIVFCNTGFERRETLDFVADFAANLGVRVDWIERDVFAPGKFRVTDYDNASRKGEPFIELVNESILRRDGTIGVRPLPSDGPRRLCSGELKTKTAHRYLRSLGWGRYASVMGFRADETDRVQRRARQDAKRPTGVICGGYGLSPMHEAGVQPDTVHGFWWGPDAPAVRRGDARRYERVAGSDASTPPMRHLP